MVANQSASDKSDLKASDLQIAKYSFGFAMAHKMGLVKLHMQDKPLSRKLTYTYTGGTTRELTSDEASSTTVSPLKTFADGSLLPFEDVAETDYYYIVKSGEGENAAFESIAGVDSWSTTFEDIGSNEFSSKDIESSRSGADEIVALFPYAGTNPYTSQYQEFTVETPGTYKIECWGASGGDTNFKSGSLVGRGGYVSGEISLTDETLYIYVGGYGTRTLKYEGFVGYGGFNGGGTTSHNGCGGGGATDVRLISGDLKSRIIVAGGGGGENNYPGLSAPTNGTAWGSKGGDAGGLRGLIYYARYYPGYGQASNYGGSQNAAGSVPSGGSPRGENGAFGVGGLGYYGAGGGGWYGGGGGTNTPTGGGGEIGGGGGSSFISGYTGCIAVNSSTGAVLSVNYMTINGKQYKFSSMSMIDGGHSMSKPDGSGNETGHIGNGYCRITYIP